MELTIRNSFWQFLSGGGTVAPVYNDTSEKLEVSGLIQSADDASMYGAMHNGNGHSLTSGKACILTDGTESVQTTDAYDPMISILSAFKEIPASDYDDLFADFQTAVESRNLRQLLDAISDWSATAELYANPVLSAEVEAARGGREEVADWLRGR